MQQMSPSLLLWKRMSSETLEDGVPRTQAEVQQKSKIKNNKIIVLSGCRPLE